ncbi:MAG: IS21-like element helper ATPase IstB [Candidatus Thiodiazotropha sp. (ex Lucinoma borealis)]|nr:IS21-like element helper ATPase IstB [Candidatus Thiodiazotropha sp. (ex Lucinoma borealis)]
MLLTQTIERLRQMRLYGMANVLEDQRGNASLDELSFEERLGLCVDAEYHDRDDRRLKRLLNAAKFKIAACPEDVDFGAHRGLDRKVFASLTTCDWIEKSLNTLIVGPTGVGKTWLACALGQQAARKGYSVIYKRLSRLLEELELAHHDGSLAKTRAKLAKTNLIILDDWALAPMTSKGRHELLEMVDDHIGTGSILITSQLPIDQWHEYLGEPTVADAILDRLVHRAHIIKLKGESMRKPKKTTRASRGRARS